MPPPDFYTIGHSTRSAEDFLRMLEAQGVKKVIDVRTIPRSARNPQFNRELLPGTLATVGMAYSHAPALGGLRKPRSDSVNLGWRNESFRGFADYMQTEAFEEAIDHLIEEGSRQRVAIMCAEAVPWRCHRSLIADALLARGIETRHIMSAAKADPHRLTKFARLNGRMVTYPAESLHPNLAL